MADNATAAFSSQAAAAFQFLVSDHGFSSPATPAPQVRVPALVGDDFEEVRFESDRVFVSIWRCPSRLDWGVDVGLLPQQRDKPEAFSVFDLATLWGADQAQSVRPMWPDKFLATALAERAHLLKEYGGPALAGDVAFFQELSAARSRRLRAHWRAQQLADATRKAAAAFRRKDWVEVVSLLAAVRSDLSPAERKKLEYAEKRARPTRPSSA
jgi:hypothetical protein